MTRSMRRFHRAAWVALALLLSILIIAATVFRHDEAVNETIPLRTAGATAEERR